MRRQVVRDATHSRKTPVVVSVSKLVSVVGDTDGHDADNIRKTRALSHSLLSPHAGKDRDHETAGHRRSFRRRNFGSEFGMRRADRQTAIRRSSEVDYSAVRQNKARPSAAAAGGYIHMSACII